MNEPRTAFLVAFFVGSAAILGCERAGPAPGTLVVAIESMPQDLDPRFSTDAASARIGRLVYRGLTRTDRRTQRIPDLALDWRWEDSTDVVFTLRSDIRFHDGTIVSAADVAATYRSILDPATSSPKREELEPIENIEVLDEATVRFSLRTPHAPFLDSTDVGILPRSELAGRSPTPIGAGPFRVSALEPNREVRLEAVHRQAGLREIRFRVVPDDTVRALEVARGGVHFVQNAIEPETLGWLREETNACIRRAPGTTFHYLGVNHRDPRLADRRIRRAIAHAIDREALVRHLLGGTARVASGLLAPSHWAHEAKVERFGHDRELAKRLLDEAGFPDPGDGRRRLELVYKTTNVESRRRLAEAIQAELAEVGIGIEIQSFEWGTFYQDVRRGNFELYSLAWVGITDPDVYRTVFHSEMTPPRGNNRPAYENAEIDRLTEEGRREIDPERRREIYSRAQKVLASDLAILPLWWTDNVVVHDERLCGFEIFPDGDLVSLRRAWWLSRPSPSQPAGPCACRDDA